MEKLLECFLFNYVYLIRNQLKILNKTNYIIILVTFQGKLKLVYYTPL